MGKQLARTEQTAKDIVQENFPKVKGDLKLHNGRVHCVPEKDNPKCHHQDIFSRCIGF